MEPSPLSDAKARLAAEVDRRADLLVDVSHQIHANPELNFEERFAHELLTGVLEREGLTVTRSAHGVATAFEATAGAAGPTVAVVCEYDALPGIGHACGHNIIAAAGLGAGLAAAALADELGGRVVVVGQPGRGGGRRQGALHRRRHVPGRRRGADGPPGGRRPAGHGRRRPAPGARHLHGRGRPRRRGPAQGAQRARRRRARATSTWRPSASTSSPASASTASSPTAATGRTSCPTTPVPSGSCARRPWSGSRSSSPASWPACRPGPMPPGARWRSSGSTRSTPT